MALSPTENVWTFALGVTMAPKHLINAGFWYPQNAWVSLPLELFKLECDAGCLECIEGGATSCTRCEKGKYLAMDGNLHSISYGECKDKTLTGGSFTIYVTPATSNDYDAQLLTGSSTEPYQDIRDAITRAYELCADYIDVCEVTILLQTGTHYIFRNYRESYRPSREDKHS